MATGVRFGLLGPLTVRHDGVEIPIAPGKQRVLLAALLLNANRVAGVDELTEVLWGPAPPVRARVTLQNYVLRLRRALAAVPAVSAVPTVSAAVLAAAGDSRISTVTPGYLIRVEAGELDIARFEALTADARQAGLDGAWDLAASRLRQALTLWRGEPLADVPSELLALREIPRLSELRLQAIEARLDADLRLGRLAEVISELRQLTVAHPLRERLHGLLMLALYRDGQQAGALAAFQVARAILVGELGTEPGTELRQLQQQILAGDPALASPVLAGPVLAGPASAGPAPAGPAPAAGGRVAPRQLPAGVSHFTGRAAELTVLTRLTRLIRLTDDRSPSQGTVVISAIGGTAGVGKTALAIHFAHLVADQFPDGQLYVDLRGYAPGQPVSAQDALASFLRALGVPGRDIPAEPQERAALYRSVLASRRMLVVLDNARHADQVRPLLPGTSGCAVVVTSRDALAGLIARNGATRLDLDLLSSADAVGLLAVLIGRRVDAEPEAAATLADQCARLPLALRLAAELAVARPAVPLAALADELSGHRQRLDLLDAGGDFSTEVRAVFSWSYRQLDPAAGDAFRRLGLHPGPDFDCDAVAALTAATPARARQLLDQLARAYLVQPAGSDRYGLHDLLRAYAADLTAVHDSEQDRLAAVTRLLDYYLYAAVTAVNILYPAEASDRPAWSQAEYPGSAPVTAVQVRDWLDAERANLVALVALAAGGGWPGHAIRLATVLARYLDEGGHHCDSLAIGTQALQAGQLAGDLAAQAGSLRSLGGAAWRQGNYQQALPYFSQALDLCQRAGDELGQARTLGALGVISYSEGRYPDAVDYHQRALAIYVQVGDRLGQARTVDNLGLTLSRLGRYRQAGTHHRRALALFETVGDQTARAGALDNLGVLLYRQGRYKQSADHHSRSLAQFREQQHRIGEALAEDNLGRAIAMLGRHAEAAGHHRQALARFRDLGSRDGEAGALDNLGRVLSMQGRHAEAADLHRQALGWYRELGNRSGEAEALNGLGEAIAAVGEIEQARAIHHDALVLASQIGDQKEQARARVALARGWQATGNLVRARHHWQRALAIYAELRVPEASQARAALENLGQ